MVSQLLVSSGNEQFLDVILTLVDDVSQNYNELIHELTHCGLGDFNEILDKYFSSQLQWFMTEIPVVKLPLEECH